jgi:hypothetical protein
MSDLQKAVNLLEAAGFQVYRAYWENYGDAGNTTVDRQDSLTGAICLRIAPVKKKEEANR